MRKKGPVLSFAPRTVATTSPNWTRVPVPVKTRYWVFNKVVLPLLNHHSNAGGFHFSSVHFIFTLAN